MSLVEEEYQLREVQVSDLRKGCVKFAEQPQQEGGVKLRVVHQLVGCQNVHYAFAGCHIYLEKVHYVKCRLSEEFVTALVFQSHQRPLDGTDALWSDVAVKGGVFCGMLAKEIQHGAKVLDVIQQEAFFIGDAEKDVEHSLLGVVEFKDSGEKLRAHPRDG